MKTNFSLMAKLAKLQIEELPEGVFIATSKDIPGLVAQGKTISETINNARISANDLYEARKELGWPLPQLSTVSKSFDYPLIFD